MFPLRLSYPSPLIFPVPVIVKVIVPGVISLQKPCQSVRAFRCDPEKYENF